MDMCVLADAHGRVELDYPYIAAVTGWPAEVLVDKLKELCSPEPSSGSQKQEGAPLALINPGRPYGWQIVNYSHYRNLRPRNDDGRKAYRRNWMRNKRKLEREQREPREHCEPAREQTVNTREHSREQPMNTGPERHKANGLEPNELQKPREHPVNSHEQKCEQSVNPIENREERYKKKSSVHPPSSDEHPPPKRNGVVDSEWLARLANDAAYSGIPVAREFGKMANWCKVNHKLPTRSRFVNWLNRIEVIDPGGAHLEPDPREDEEPEWTRERVNATRALFPGIKEALFERPYVHLAGDVRAQIECEIKKTGGQNGSR